MDELVQRLTEGNHPIVLVRYTTAEELKQALDRSYVLMKFTDTHGGTELGVRLDTALTDLSLANFHEPSGTVRLVGTLSLNYVKVRCIADLQIDSLQGYGHLEILEQQPA